MANVASWLCCLWMGKHWAGMVSVMRPLFEVGEEVMLVSKSEPAANGSYLVTEVLHHAFHGCCPYGYRLDIDPIQNEPDGYFYAGWCQCALRKKPESGDSFESFMDELKQPIKQPVMVEK